MIAIRSLRGESRADAALISVSERARYLLAVRIAIATWAALFAAFRSDALTVRPDRILAASLVYVLVSIAPHFVESRGRAVVPLFRGLLLLDGIAIAGLIAVTGGSTSPFRILAVGHVIAVTLLFSYRSGLKIALWHTLLYLVVAAAEPAAVLGDGDAGGRWTVVVSVAALWSIGLATASFAALSERELRRQKVDLERLSSMLGRIQLADDAPEIGRILLAELCDAFDFQRGAVLAAPEGDLTAIAAVGTSSSSVGLIGMEPLAYRTRSERESVAVRALDHASDPELAALVPDARNVLLVPLLVERGKSIGLIVLERGGHERTIRRSVVSMVEQFASHGALALNNAWLAEERLARLQEIEELRRQLEIVNAGLEVTIEERTAELRAAVANLEEVDRQRRRLLHHVVRAGEEERRRIAGDIHDDPVQKLVALKMRLELLAKAHPDLPAVREATDTVLGTIRSLRHLLFDLRPPVLDEQGLGPALRSFLENSEATFRWSVRDEAETDLDPQSRLILYRIAQEALTNARKHAEAEHVEIRVSAADGGVAMEITDDGVGFEPLDAAVAAPGHMGLAAIRERAEMAGGRCELHSLPGQGTTLDVWLPGSATRDADGTESFDPALVEGGVGVG